MSEDRAYRDGVYKDSAEHLQAMVNRHIILKKADPGTLVAACIMVDDPLWGDLATRLVPDHDWQQYRDKGADPIARGVLVRSTVADLFNEIRPDVAKLLRQGAPLGHVHAVILAKEGFSVYELPYIVMGSEGQA